MGKFDRYDTKILVSKPNNGDVWYVPCTAKKSVKLYDQPGYINELIEVYIVSGYAPTFAEMTLARL